MQFARFWKAAKGHPDLPDGVAWGWSNVSPEAAQDVARTRLDALVHWLRTRETSRENYNFNYGERPPREAVERTILPEKAVVTRSQTGCEILNTSAAVFVDVDIPDPHQTNPGPLDSVLRIFGKKPVSLRDRQIEDCLNRLRVWVQHHPSDCFRVYETAGGLRYFLLSSEIAPESDARDEMFKFLGADPAYSELCRQQKSYRARLTPKPWRMGLSKPACRFPFETSEAENEFAVWLQEYQAAAKNRATCRFLSPIGTGRPLPELEALANAHDAATNALQPLPLA